MVNDIKMQVSDRTIDLSNSNIDYSHRSDITLNHNTNVNDISFDLNLEQEEPHKFYNLAKYYDLAFLRDPDRDIEFFISCFK